jgi:hypothetical protein
LFERRTWQEPGWTLEEIVAAKNDRTVSVVLPALNEEETVGEVVASVRPLLGSLVDASRMMDARGGRFVIAVLDAPQSQWSATSWSTVSSPCAPKATTFCFRGRRSFRLPKLSPYTPAVATDDEIAKIQHFVWAHLPHTA